MAVSIFALTRTVVLAAVTAIVAYPPGARSDEVWRVEGKLVGKAKDGEEKKAKDISGIACAETSGFPRHCLVIDDETQIAQFVTLEDKLIAAGETIRLIDDKFAGKPVELDGEGVAYYCSESCYFYVMGSHGRPRAESAHPGEAERAKIAARELASSRLIRIKVDPATGLPNERGAVPTISTKLKELISGDDTLGPILGRPLNQDGITIEGIAILNGRLFAGFRGPSEKGAAILSAALGAFFEGKPADPKLSLLSLGEGRGVRDLAVYGDRILILAGPTMGEGGPFSIYSWDGSGANVELLKDLPSYGSELKPEALLPLDQDATSLRVLLLLDGEKDGGPRTERIKIPR